jgi:hypothetical protein
MTKEIGEESQPVKATTTVKRLLQEKNCQKQEKDRWGRTSTIYKSLHHKVKPHKIRETITLKKEKKRYREKSNKTTKTPKKTASPARGKAQEGRLGSLEQRVRSMHRRVVVKRRSREHRWEAGGLEKIERRRVGGREWVKKVYLALRVDLRTKLSWMSDSVKMATGNEEEMVGGDGNLQYMCK